MIFINKFLSKKVTAVILSILMVLSTLMSPWNNVFISPKVKAAGIRFNDILGSGGERAGTEAGEGESASTYKSGVPVNLIKALKNCDNVQWTGVWKKVVKNGENYSGKYEKIFDRMKDNQPSSYGNTIYCADLTDLAEDNTKYCGTKYRGVQLMTDDEEPVGEKIDVEFRYWHPAIRNNSITDLNEGAGDEKTGPLIGAYASKEAIGVMGWNGYKRLRCEIIITDAGKSTLSKELPVTIGIMDIDAGQGVATNQASASMIRNGFKGKGDDAKAPQWGDNNLDNDKYYGNRWRAFLADVAEDLGGRDAAPLSVYDPHDQGGLNYDETSANGALVLDLTFSGAKNQFSYWYFTGARDFDDGEYFGTQTGRVFQYLKSEATFLPPVEPIEPPILKKFVNGKKEYVLPSGGDEFEYTLETPIAEEAASTITGSNDVTLQEYSWEDTLVDELEIIPDSVRLTLNGNNVSASKYNASVSGQTIKVTLTNPDKNIEGGKYVVHFKSKIKKGKSLAKYIQPAGADHAGYAKIPNYGKVTFKVDQENKQKHSVAYGDDPKDPSKRDTVYVYWKPAARPDPKKTVNKTHLTDGDETWHYTVTQTMPANTWPFGYMQKFEIVDKVDDCLVIVPNSVKINTNGFNISTNGNKIVATSQANNEALFAEGTQKDIVLEYDVTFNKDYSYRLKSIKPHSGQLTDGEGYNHIVGNEEKVLVKNNATVETKWDSWGEGWNDKKTTPTVSTDVDIPTITVPKKDVSDEDESNVAKDTLTDGDEVWTYKITQKIPEHTASIYRYTSFNIKDQIDPCLTIGKNVKSGETNLNDIVVKISGKEMNRTDMAVNVSNNLVTVTPSAGLLQGGSNNVFYGEGNKGSTITIEIPVHIYSGGNEGGSDASNKAVLEKLRAHNHFNNGDSETTLTFKNKATTTVDDMINRTPETLDTEEVTTTLSTPQIKAPKKYVSDKDDLNWDHSVEKNGENKDLAQNRISDAAREWIYTIEQDVPDHTVPLFYYKSFSFKDKVDTCLEYDPEDAIVTINGKEYGRDYFKVALDKESNLFTVTATDKALKAADFYGYGGNIDSPNKGTKIRVQFPVHIKVDPEHPYDTATLKAHAHLKQDDQGHQVYEFINGDNERETKSIINNLIKDNGNAPDFDDERKVEKSVKTQVEVPQPDIEKKADRFEWEVGEDVKYTITVKNKNPMSIMDRVTITDDDLPDSLQLNGEKEDAIMVYAEDATQNYSAPGNKDSIPNPRGLLTEVEDAQITDAAQPWWKEATDNEAQIDNITKQCEVTYFNDQGDTGNGFKVMVPKQYRGETITITFLCRVTEDYADCISTDKNTCSNGKVVSNTARVYSTNMLEDEEIKDEEHIWINTPHLSIQKYTGAWNYENGEFQRVDEDENQTNYKPGDKVHYTVLIKNNHEGTLARGVNFTDEILDEGLMLDGNSIEVFKIRLDSNGKPAEKYGQTGTTRMKEGTDYDMTVYGNTAFEIYFKNRTLRHWGDSPFNASVPDYVNNGKYETGAAPDTKVPGMKRTDEKTYSQTRDVIKYRDDVAYTVDGKGNATGELADANSLWLKDQAYANTWDKYPVNYRTALENGKASDTMNSWKSLRTVQSHPQEWADSDTAYIISYDATTTKGISLGKGVRNEVYVDSENSFLAKNETSIIVDGPKLAIDKSSDKQVYSVGSTGKYRLEVTETQNEGIAKNVVIKDNVANVDADIDLDSVKVTYYKNKQDYRLNENYEATGGEDITASCEFPEDSNNSDGIYINTGRDLDQNGIIVVTYDMKFFEKSLQNKTIPNTAAAKGDNTSPELVEYTAWTPVSDSISVRKSSEPYSGVVVKQGEEITYMVGIRNTSDEDLYNVLVRDKIPALTTYVDGSAHVMDGGNTASTAGGFAKFLAASAASDTTTEPAADGQEVTNGENNNDEGGEAVDNGDTNTAGNEDGETINNENGDDQGQAQDNESGTEATVDNGTVAAVLPALHAHETRYLVFKVTVNDEATDADFIRNVAELYDASEEEIPKNTKFSNEEDFPENIKELFGSDKFALTNETVHPLSNWAVDNNLVRVIGGGDIPTKEADKAEYNVGDTIRYTATYNLTTDDAKVDDVLVVDKVEAPGLINLKGKDAFKVYLNGNDITADVQDLVFNEEKDGYSFRLGKEFRQSDSLMIKYEAVALAEGIGKEDGIKNTVTFNNSPAFAVVHIVDPDNWLKIDKTSDKEVYGLTTQPMLDRKDLTYVAHYTVKVKNDKDGEARNVVISDAFEKEGMVIDPASIKISLTNEKTPDGEDITDAVEITPTDNSYEIKTGRDLKLNDFFTVTYDVTFRDPELAKGPIVNTAKAKADNVDEVKTDHNVKVLIPEITVDKKSNAIYYSVGQTGNYTVKTSQIQEGIKAINVVISDKLSSAVDGFNIVPNSIVVTDTQGKDITDKVASIEVDEDQKGFTIHTGMNLEAGEFFQVDYKVDFKNRALEGTAIQNVAEAKCDNAPEVSADNEVEIPGMNIHKASDPVSGTTVKIPVVDENGQLVLDENGNPQFEKEEIVYKIQVTNTTDAPMTNVLVRDMIPEFTEWKEGGEVQKIDEKDYVTFVIDSIEPGEKKEVTFTVKVVANGLGGQKLVRNVAQVKQGGDGEPEWGGDGWYDTNRVEHPIPNVVIINKAGLAIEKHSDKQVYDIGETGHYTVTVTESEPNATATNVIIKDNLEDKGVVIDEGSIRIADNDGKDITGDVKITADKLSYYIETGRNLSDGEKFTVTYNVTFNNDSIANETLTNIAKSTAENLIPEPPTPDEPVAYDGYTVLKSSDPVDGTLVKVGDDIVYTITVNNTSEEALKNVLVMDAVPLGTTYKEGGNLREDGYVTFCIPEIAAGESANVSFTATVNEEAGESVKNVALVKPAEEGDNPEDPTGWNPDTFNPTNEVEHPLHVWVEDDNQVEVKAPVLDITKDADKKVYNIDETAHYTVVVKNTQPDTEAKNVIIKDNFQIQGVSILNDTIKISDKDGKDITGSVKITTEEGGYLIETGMNLKTDEFFTVTYDARFTSKELVSKDVLNIAKAKADNAVAVTSNDVTPVVTEDGLIIRKDSTPPSGTRVKNGSEITYNIYVENPTSEKKENVLILDKVPDLTTYVPSSGGDLTEINGEQYVSFMIPEIEPGMTDAVCFTVTVSEDATENDTILNVALVKTADKEDPNDPKTWNPDEFTPTNQVEHPLSNWVKDDETVTVTGNEPLLKIAKTSDKDAYEVGETGHYTVAVKQIASGQIAKNVVITDALQTKGAKITANSIKVYKIAAKEDASAKSETEDASKEEDKNSVAEAASAEENENFAKGLDLSNAEDITKDVIIDSTATGYKVTTKKDLAFDEMFVVTYDVLFESESLAGTEVKNIATAEADNVPPVQTEHNVPINKKGGPKLQITKASNKETYKLGETGTYTLKITNTEKGTVATNVVVHDEFENHKVELNTKSIVIKDGDGKTVNWKPVNNSADTYYGFKIATGVDLAGGKTMTVTYKVKFNNKSLVGKKLKNTAIAKADNTDQAKDDNTVTIEKKDDTTKNPTKKDTTKDNPKNDNPSQTTNTVKTGDVLFMILLAGIVVMVITGGVYAYRRRKLIK